MDKQMKELDALRQELIERIKQVFPTKGKKGLKLARQSTSVVARRLKDTFGGKRWEEVVSESSLVYNLSDLDHLREITDVAYLYYLPAFLVATLYHPEKWIYYSFPIEKMYSMRSKFSVEQLDVLIAFFEYHAQLRRIRRIQWQEIPSYEDEIAEELEDMLLRLMIRRDEL